MRAILELMGAIAALFAGVFIYDRYFVDHNEPKPVITMDSTYYWISASQIDTLKYLRGRIDSFGVAAKRSNWRYFEKFVHDTVKIIDSIAGLPGPLNAEIWEKDTVLGRGPDSVALKMGFTMTPYPLFVIKHSFNDDHVLVKEIRIETVLPAPKKLFTHGFSVGPAFGLINKKLDIGIGYTFTIHF